MTTSALLLRLLSAALYLAAAVSLFFFLFNRWILFFKRSRTRSPAVLAAFALLVSGALTAGWRTGWSPWLGLPVAVLAAFLVGEVCRLRLRRRLRGAPPVALEKVAMAWHRPLTTTALAVAQYAIAAPRWPGGRLRVAHLSDLHLNGFLPDAYYERVMARVTQADPDLVLLTGDLICEPEFAAHLPRILGGLQSRLGLFAVLGNHDYWADAELARAGLRQAGVRVLGNTSERLTLPDGSRLLLGGCEVPWGDGQWTAPRIAPDELALALTHTGDNIYRLSLDGFAAVFAGHYHAGQLVVPWVGPLMVPSMYGRRFAHGHFVVNGAHFFVTAGIGTARIPWRIYCPPDLFLVDIRGARA